METKGEDIIPQLSQRGCRRGARQTSADDDYIVFALIGRVDQLELELVLFPLFR